MDLERIRKDFPILETKINGNNLIYLDNAATSQKPKSVINSLVDYYEKYNSNVHRGVHSLSVKATDEYEKSRSKVREFINAGRDEEIIYTRNASESLNIIAHSWGSKNINKGSANLNVEGSLNLLNKKINFKKININKSYVANEIDMKYFKETFENILFDGDFFAIFRMNKIKEFLLEVIFLNSVNAFLIDCSSISLTLLPK